MLLALASVVFLGSEFLGTRNHLLLSQILDFLFRRLLRLAGSRWRHSNPPPQGAVKIEFLLIFKNQVRTSQEAYYVTATKTNRLMLFREIIVLYCENHMRHTNTLCGQDVD
jgi:hypothetical protein